mmetsp:Transcript_34379/g.63687  ORF Transcript_34379/g.63687 Transcript_34379/m.63687 type:complete len:365 (+) Transcript_34379:111-1205(+)
MNSSLAVSPGSITRRSIFDEASIASSSSLRILRKVNTVLSTAEATPAIASTLRHAGKGKQINGTHAVSPVASLSTASSVGVRCEPAGQKSSASNKERRLQHQVQHPRGHCGTRYWPAGARPEQMTRSRRRELRTSTAAIGERIPASSSRAICGPKEPGIGRSSQRNSEALQGNMSRTKEACGRALLSAALRLHMEEEFLNSLSRQAGVADANGQYSFSAEMMDALREHCNVEFMQDLHQLPESRILALTGIPEDEKARLIRLCAYLRRKLPYEDLKSAQLPVKRTFIHFKRTPTADIEGCDCPSVLRDSAPGQMERSKFHTKDAPNDESQPTGRALTKEHEVDRGTSEGPIRSDELFNTHDSFL